MPTAQTKRLLRERINRKIAGDDRWWLTMPRHQRVCGCCDGWHRVKTKRLCLVCHRVDNDGLPCCRANSVTLGYHVRVPRRTASVKQWQRFLRRFVIARETAP